ncbi:MAG: NADP-dependent malic enzyme [Campylobacterota bacterium]|nr:NADP-dependent malic enzyme [Campylobacterota bacterium]
MKSQNLDEKEALIYHEIGRPGKIEVIATKPFKTQRDLGLAYTPGVASVCSAIEQNPLDAFKYTAKGNLVAVVTNGTAVLGLGNIGAVAAKPVMEGKGVLFKKFADVDVFDIELDTEDPDELICTVKRLGPTFGAVNLEDIKAPECFYIEEKLKEIMNIPVFHDDQHGTATITGAALLNALEIAKKDIRNIKIVISGAGAAGLACADYFKRLGANEIIVCDSKGVIYKGRKESMNPYKEKFAAETQARTLEQAMRGADAFLGVSAPHVVNKEMVRTMGKPPIIFAMANPIPEIDYEDAKDACPDAIVGTGRSDYPNQINNVLVFPFIFRGALDARATTINHEMMIAASKAIATLAKEDVPESVLKAYGLKKLKFGPDYIIPKPFDPRALEYVAPAVAKAAISSGVAQIKKVEEEKYKEELEARIDKVRIITRSIYNRAKENPKKVVFPDSEEEEILRAIKIITDEGIARPIFLGERENIEKRLRELDIHRSLLEKVEIIDPFTSKNTDKYIMEYFKSRERKGITYKEAERLIKHRRYYFGAMMVKLGDADAIVAGEPHNYPYVAEPILKIIGVRKDNVAAGVYMLIIRNKVYFLADTTMIIEPSAEQLACIAIETANLCKEITNTEPVIAMLSFSNFGSNREYPQVDKVRKATKIIEELQPSLTVDGEMQANIAVDKILRDKFYPFNNLKGKDANVLIFPDLNSANIAYKLVYKLGDFHPVGPILVGLEKSAHILEMGSSPDFIVDLTAIAVIDAQVKEKGV